MSSDSDSDHPVSAAEEAFQQRQMAVVKRLGALGVAMIRGVDEDVEPRTRTRSSPTFGSW